jgi:mono/diheme cytochrome c family protein
MRLAPAMFTLLALALSASAPSFARPAEGMQDKKPVSYEKDLQPIFKQSCLSCHKTDKKKGKLDMSTYDVLMKGGKQGPAVKPGDPAKSILVEMITGPEPEMPEKGDKLKPEQIELISRWIKEGAKQN